LSGDPKDDIDSASAYAFVGQKPHACIDPMGLQAQENGEEQESIWDRWYMKYSVLGYFRWQFQMAEEMKTRLSDTAGELAREGTSRLIGNAEESEELNALAQEVPEVADQEGTAAGMNGAILRNKAEDEYSETAQVVAQNTTRAALEVAEAVVPLGTADDALKYSDDIARSADEAVETASASLGAGRSGVRSAGRASRSGTAPGKAAKYVFDSRAGRYREVASGRFVSPRDLPWPANRGFASSTQGTVPQGTIIDRFGAPTGRYAGQPGATVSARGMAPGADAATYTQYKVLRPIPAEIGPAAPVPAFGAEGGATQYFFQQSIGDLVEQGFLEVVK
jgi:hypothetical protein